MKKLMTVILIFVLLASVVSLSSCSDEEMGLNVKSYDGFIAFVFGVDSDATTFFANYTPFATTRTSLDSFLKLGDTVGTGITNMGNKLIESAVSILSNPVNLVATTFWAVLYLIGMVLVVGLSLIIALFLLLFFICALLYDTLMLSMYGLTLAFVFFLRALVYVFVDLGLGAWLMKKLMFPSPF